jgi:hypothetical protein
MRQARPEKEPKPKPGEALPGSPDRVPRVTPGETSGRAAPEAAARPSHRG